MWSPSSPPPRGRAGFTLVELLVAMVIGVLLAGIIFELLRGQGKFVAVQSAKQDVQQNARGALEVLTSELRGAPVQGIEEATGMSITFRVPRAWGVYCGGTAAQMHAVFPNLSDDTYTPGSATGVMAKKSATSWEADGVQAAATFSVAAAGNQCSGIRLPSLGNATADGVTFTAANGAQFPTGLAGKAVFLYDLVRYDVGAGPDGGERWIRRSNGLDAGAPVMQPLAGPVPSTSGLRLTYLDNAGASVTIPTTATAVTAATGIVDLAGLGAPLTTLRRVSVSITSTRTREGVSQTETDSLTVHLRNRP